ncbi:DUF6114 domain-containing protein [Micromonospora eburnea]|uniref:Uncharacterized protein n=1 Tax=Micromonospora eburnea TaxID=227316 RepID=A0A1C6VN76_9ACTN|nr:DUF6114 domain-containing protein [Micromonospora eburnea]SCL67799.1 hypothetical protein GA0070604_6101 [Micromonospora eburnea]
MTTADAQHARPGGFTRAWRGFRRWRRSRPFWGGLFAVLAGAEIFGTTQATLAGLTLKMGPTGFLAWLIPTILVVCGLLLWFTPQHRIFYSVIAAVTAVYSLIGVNLGGFFLGMLLGIVGAGLGFAWMPGRPASTGEQPVPAVDEGPQQDDEVEQELALVDELLPRQREEETTGVLTDILPESRNPLREVPPAEAADSTQSLPSVGPDPAHRGPKSYAILLAVAMSLAGLFALRGEEHALAAPATCPTHGPAAPTPGAADPSPAASVSASPAPAPVETGSDGNLLTDIVDGITGLLTGDHTSSSPESNGPAAPAVAAEPTETGTTPTSAEPEPSASSSAKPTTPDKPGADPCASPAPTKPKPVEPGKPLPRIAADPDQPQVAVKPAKLTGSKLAMTGLRFEGITELPTENGPLKCLKFTMAKAVTDDFVLQADGPAGRTQRYVTDQLTVEGDVAFYTTRFVARFEGIKVTLTPDLPLPDGIPITLPLKITFTEPVIDLAFVDSNTLTAKPALKLDLG